MTELCSTLSRTLGEPLRGTAVAETSVWIVLEHRGPWGAKAVEESSLPPAVKQQLAAWEAGIPGARIQLARRSGRVVGPLRLWVGVSDLVGARLLERTLADEGELLGCDVPGWVQALRRGEAVEGTQASAAPLVLVCTNGRRDVCCSKLGIPVGQALDPLPGLDVWQTTHLGGHRFAATLLVLPEGLCYGRVEPQEAPQLAEAIAGRRIHRLDRLRGRTALAEPEQAAEILWRERTGRLELDALVHVEHEAQGDHVRVTLRDRDGRTHHVEVVHRDLGVSAPPSCGKPPAAVMAWLPA